MLDVILFLVIVVLLWLLAIEIRFHSLKNVIAESRELAADASNALHRVLHIGSAPKGKSSKR